MRRTTTPTAERTKAELDDVEKLSRRRRPRAGHQRSSILVWCYGIHVDDENTPLST